MDKLYIAILEKITANATVFTDQQLPAPRFIDLYRGQPHAPERFEAMFTPCIFIEYEIDWKAGELTLNLHVMLDMNHPTSSVSPNRLKGLDIIKFYKVLNTVVENLESENTGKLKRTNERPAETDAANYQIITYNTSISPEPVIDNTQTEVELLNVEISGELKKFIV